VERFLLLFVTLFLTFSLQSPALAGMKGGKNMTGNIHWLGHDTFKITGEKTIYTDPFTVSRKDRADIILITHEHYDHCSPDDVKKLQGPDTVIIATADCARKLTGNIRTIRPGDTVTVEKTVIEAVPAYNTNKKFHPRDNGWVGYIFTVEGKRIYLAGDTDLIPEMKTIKADIAILPVSGKYVMTAEEAVQAALTIQPQVAIPMHYGSIVGSASDAKKFQEKLQGKIEVVILPKE
jgi:L-ascorbate metabolism protein UlaG (beta-lactamase superfamily)